VHGGDLVFVVVVVVAAQAEQEGVGVLLIPDRVDLFGAELLLHFHEHLEASFCERRVFELGQGERLGCGRRTGEGILGCVVRHEQCRFTRDQRLGGILNLGRGPQ
jgi:hypothetical protein